MPQMVTRIAAGPQAIAHMSGGKKLGSGEERRVREVFERVPFPRLLGMRIEELGRGVCRLSVALRDDLRQRYGVMHGGVIATLVDTAAAYAIYPEVASGREITTVEMKISFLSSVREGGRAEAEARLLRLGRTLAVCACDVFDGGGKRVAAALVTYMVIPARTADSSRGRPAGRPRRPPGGAQ